MPSPLPEAIGRCDHCGGRTYWWDAWGETCGSWWAMEGGCPDNETSLWGDWTWTDA